VHASTALQASVDAENLIEAAAESTVPVTKMILARLGIAAVDDHSGMGATALWHACCEENEATAEYLLRVGACPSLPSMALTPLCVAAMEGHTDIVKLLIAHKADVEKDAEFSPLSLAIANEHAGIVKLLLSAEGSEQFDAGDERVSQALREAPQSRRVLSAAERRAHARSFAMAEEYVQAVGGEGGLERKQRKALLEQFRAAHKDPAEKRLRDQTYDRERRVRDEKRKRTLKVAKARHTAKTRMRNDESGAE
jgi:hypothetical protein